MKKLILISLIFLIIIFSACVQDPYKRDFAGVTLRFRANLNEADKVPVYPNETALGRLLMNSEIKRIVISYIPNDSENPYYLAASYEIAYKLTIIYKYYYGDTRVIDTGNENETCLLFIETNRTMCIQPLAIDSKDELITTDVQPAFLLLGPSQTNETSVRVEENLIIASGKNFEEEDRTYTDLDLAVDKILLILMGE